jgi:GNAT superfamily N-acetyltransferase
MQRIDAAPTAARFPGGVTGAWASRRWYYTPKSHRAYSVRQISSGDRRMLAEFAQELSRSAPERERVAAAAVTSMIFDHVVQRGSHAATGFVALQRTGAGDRVIGVAVCVPGDGGNEFCVAVSANFREEQVGRTLLLALVRHARHAGISRLAGDISWSNRPMQLLAISAGFGVEPVPRDRNLRRLVLRLK